MARETVVLDNSDIPGMIAAAGVQIETPEKPAETEKTEGKADAKPEEKAAEAPSKETEKAVKHDGLTDEEKRTYTEAMKKSVAWRHGKMKEAQEQAAQERQGRQAAEEKLRLAEEELARVRNLPPLQPKQVDEEPTPDKFDTTEKYISARVKWETTQAIEADRKERQEREAKEEQESRTRTARERIASAIAHGPEDYEEVTGSADVPVPAHIAAEMMDSELFAELGYYFGKHPDEMERISKLRPSRALLELGKIESTLQPFAHAEAKVEPNGGSPKPDTAADGQSPSRARVLKPVIRPLSPRGPVEPEVTEAQANPRGEIRNFERRRGSALTQRRRH